MAIHESRPSTRATVSALVLAALAAAALLVAALPIQAQGVTFRLVHAVNPDHPYHLGALAFAEQMERETNGEIQVEVYSQGAFGSQVGADERAQVEALVRGEVEIVITGSAVLSNWVPELRVLDLPFVIRDYAHADAVLDGPVGSRLLALFDERSTAMKPLGMWEQGYRHLTNSRGPVLVPEDVRGLRVRVQENEIHKAAFEALGAEPVQLPWDQAVQALRAGVVEGQENPLAVIVSYHLYEIHPYLALTGHFYAPAMMLISEDAFNGLSPEHQAILLRASADASREARRLTRSLESDEIERLRSAGTHITQPDKELFREAMAPVYGAVTDPVERELVDLILDAGGI